jgi:lincosamide nucleotidyltransferase A/C/D/E
MAADDVLEVLRRLDAAGIDWWIDGGWGVDALLGEQTRAHDDLDFAVRRESVDRLQTVFPEFERVHGDHWPGAFVLRDARGRELDFHPLEFDEGGNGWQTGTDGRSHLWSREALAAHGRIGGRPVRCTSVAFQMDSHLYPGYDDVDWDDVRVLSEHFRVAPPAGYGRRPGRLRPGRGAARPRV